MKLGSQRSARTKGQSPDVDPPLLLDEVPLEEEDLASALFFSVALPSVPVFASVLVLLSPDGSPASEASVPERPLLA